MMETSDGCSIPGTLRVAGKLVSQGKAGAGHSFLFPLSLQKKFIYRYLGLILGACKTVR